MGRDVIDDAYEAALDAVFTQDGWLEALPAARAAMIVLLDQMAAEQWTQTRIDALRAELRRHGQKA